MSDYTITTENNPEMFRDTKFKDGAEGYSFDFSPWAEKYGNITTATWTVKSGNASVSNKALSNNVATALVSFPEAGRSLIQLKADTGSEIYIAYLEIMAKDPASAVSSDYGFYT